MNIDTSIFKDYDIRGVYPDQLNKDIARAIGYAIVRKFTPKTVAICRDMRTSGPEIWGGLMEAFTKAGVNVFDAGLTGTELAYYIAGTSDYDMVIMISASHNPAQYNGLKMVLKGPVAVSGDTGLMEIKELVKDGPLPDSPTPGTVTSIDPFDGWRKKVLSLVDLTKLKPLSVVVDAGNGMAGKLVPQVFEGLPLKITPMYFELDGAFPNHTPNPLILSNNSALIAKVKELGAHVGLTFDGDADRVFFIDDTGRFVSGSIITALLAHHVLEKHPGAYVLYSAVCGRIVPETITKYGGKYHRVRVGHSFMKAYMKQYGAIFAGEHSGHYYHRDYFNSESGVLTALMVLSLISQDGRKFSDIVSELDIYPASGEINYKVPDATGVLTAVKEKYNDADTIDELDGLSIWYKTHWINLRVSKTEPLIRLNVEADTKEILDVTLTEIQEFIKSKGGVIQ